MLVLEIPTHSTHNRTYWRTIMPSCIYLITNTINQKQYIGFTTKSPEKRLVEHFKDKRNRHVCNSLRFYGLDKFTIEVLYQSKQLDHCKNVMEPYFIAEYNTYKGVGYNMTLGGEGTPGKHWSEESKLKISKANKGRKHSEKTKQNMREAQKHRPPISEETRLKMSKSSKGRPMTEENKIKLGNRSRLHQTPPKYELIDMITLFTNIEIANFYGSSSATVTVWKKKHNMIRSRHNQI